MSIFSKTKGKEKDFMAVKLDMSKAYDRVEWGFLKAMVDKMGFCKKWVELIMKCIKTVSYSFNINEETNEYITPDKGIRQSDPGHLTCF